MSTVKLSGERRSPMSPLIRYAFTSHADEEPGADSVVVLPQVLLNQVGPEGCCCSKEEVWKRTRG
jgi:hypothetical protein